MKYRLVFCMVVKIYDKEPIKATVALMFPKTNDTPKEKKTLTNSQCKFYSF